jgi:hypothetical protein
MTTKKQPKADNAFLLAYQARQADNAILDQFDIPVPGEDPVTVSFRRDLPAAVPLLNYQIQRMMDAPEPDDPDARAAFIAECKELMQRMREMLFGKGVYDALLFRAKLSASDIAELELYAFTDVYGIYRRLGAEDEQRDPLATP